MAHPTAFHLLRQEKNISLPEKFTFPFHYTPHPLCVEAAGEVQQYLSEQEDKDPMWKTELQKGKMFGVLVVETVDQGIGFLAAYSGILCGGNRWPYFVPPVYDLLSSQSYFPAEEAHISGINRQIKEMQQDAHLLFLQERLDECRENARKKLEEWKAFMKQSKTRRDEARKNPGNPEQEAALIKESQFQKAEYKRMERDWNARILSLEKEIQPYTEAIRGWKDERKRCSAELQRKLFASFRVLNARGEEKDLLEIFRDTPAQLPPAGAGECAAPKLLQYAYSNKLRPVAMAEFWWGNSPKNELRKHGYYYPACKSKCEPILGHMLEGLDVEENPLISQSRKTFEPTVIYEDEWLAVVDKPAGMLSVPGKTDADSVFAWARRRYPEAGGPLLVHRLDMATSGLLLIAKSKEIHQNLQAQFKNRSIRKRYIALLDGKPARENGEIRLPLCPDPHERPRQLVSETHGKPALTTFQLTEYDEKTGRSRVTFSPHTGRTHQLRVHAAHPNGLDTPISGDEIYGKKAERLYLHAEMLEFTHPVSGKIIRVQSPPEF